MATVMTDTQVDWSRLARPQTDEYDTEVTLAFASRAGYRRPSAEGCLTIFDGEVALRPLEPDSKGRAWGEQGPLDHPNLARAANLLRRWPEGSRQFRRLIHSVYPVANARFSPVAFPNSVSDEAHMKLGSSSHSDEERFGTLYATVYDPIGTAQAFVHEMAHQKLRALGVRVESADRFVANPPAELFESPVRKDKPRPMTAVVHALYSWMYIVGLDLRMIEYELDQGAEPSVLRLFRHYLVRNVPRLDEGLTVVHANLEVDEEGALFFGGLFEWGADLLQATYDILNSVGDL